MANNNQKIRVRFRCGHEEEKEVSRTILQNELIHKWEHCLCTACTNKLEDKKYPPDQYRLIRIHYSKYVDEYKGCHARLGSYDPDTKYISVYITR